MNSTAYRHPESLADPALLQARLDDPGLRIVEVDVSTKAYEQGHIPGAVLWNIYHDLKDANYQLVEPAAVQRLLERSVSVLRRKWSSTATPPRWGSGSCAFSGTKTPAS